MRGGGREGQGEGEGGRGKRERLPASLHCWSRFRAHKVCVKLRGIVTCVEVCYGVVKIAQQQLDRLLSLCVLNLRPTAHALRT